MAALALPALEAAVTALLVAAGVGVGAAVVTDEAKRRQRAASDAGTSEVARTASQTRPKTCEKCPPDCGSLKRVNHHMSPGSRDYQARVTDFLPGTEWGYQGIDFDGFSSADCHLKEAKGRYAQFLSRDPDGRIVPKWFFTEFDEGWLRQARKQAVVAITSPPARLTWFLQDEIVYEYTRKRLMAFPPLVVVYFP